MSVQESIDNLATKAKALESGSYSWIWKVVAGAAVALGIWWVKWQLDRKSNEIATTKTELATSKLNAQQAAVAAQVETDDAKRLAAEGAAKDALSKAAAAEKDLAVTEADHQIHVQKLKAVADKDWDALNKIAGVKP